MITPQSIRDKINSIRSCKHPQRQRDLLFRTLEDIVDHLETVEKEHAMHVSLLAQEHRAECAELERRFNERFTCDKCEKWCVCHAPKKTKFTS